MILKTVPHPIRVLQAVFAACARRAVERPLYVKERRYGAAAVVRATAKNVQHLLSAGGRDAEDRPAPLVKRAGFRAANPRGAVKRTAHVDQACGGEPAVICAAEVMQHFLSVAVVTLKAVPHPLPPLLRYAPP